MDLHANGIRFRIEVEGPPGAPWVVFSNSLMTNLAMWDEQAAALAGDFRVCRYDQRGHGGTEASAGAYTFDLLVADLIALFDALQIDRADLVGLSMGGMTAVRLAERHPDRVRRLVACDCGPASTPQSRQQWQERIAIATRDGMERLVEPTVERWFSAESRGRNQAAVDKTRQMIRTTSVDGFVGCASALSDFDLRPALGDITAPVQIICGTSDAALPGARALHAGIAHSAFVEIPGAGHISNLDQPELFSKALRDFLIPES